MSDPRQLQQPEAHLDESLVQQARLAGDVIEVGPHTWAIHSVIPVDGDVIIGAFESSEDAHAAIDRLSLPGDTKV